MISIGSEFNARKTYPFGDRGRKTEEQTDDIRYGERVRVTDYNKENRRYTLLNLSLGNPEAWVQVTEEELRTIKGQ